MLMEEGGPWAIIILILGILSMVPTFISLLKRGEPRFFALAVGITLTAFSFSIMGTCLGLYQMGQSFQNMEDVSTALFAQGLGIAIIPLLFGSVFFAFNMFLLGISQFIRG